MSLQPLFAYQYKEQYPVDGWKVYDPMTEYRRQVTAHQHNLPLDSAHITQSLSPGRTNSKCIIWCDDVTVSVNLEAM